MKNWTLSLILLAISINTFASGATSVLLESPKAGIDYPTDAPVDTNFKVLVIEEKRIIVPSEAKLEKSVAGIEYPTDAPVSEDVRNAQVLVIGGKRVVVSIETAKAGIDYPTDAPVSPKVQSSLVWAFSNSTRIFVSDFYFIRKAKAGIDYPTDGPPGMKRDFLVVQTLSGQNRAITN